MSSDTPSKSYPNERDCEHGCQRGKCVHCDLADALKTTEYISQLERELAEAIEQNRNLLLGSTWVCVHCGYFAKSKDGQNELKAHIAECPNHPMAALKAELAEARKELAEYRAATDPHYVDELAALKAENERLAKALEEVLPRLLELKLFQSAHICQQALASRGRENEQANPKLNRLDAGGPPRASSSC